MDTRCNECLATIFAGHHPGCSLYTKEKRPVGSQVSFICCPNCDIELSIEVRVSGPARIQSKARELDQLLQTQEQDRLETSQPSQASVPPLHGVRLSTAVHQTEPVHPSVKEPSEEAKVPLPPLKTMMEWLEEFGYLLKVEQKKKRKQGRLKG